MRIWKIISGILSIAIAALVAFPSFFSELLHITGQATGGAGMAVAAMLLAGGIISIAASRGSMAADIALICLYGLGSLVGFTMAGTYDSLLLWALWCLLCAALAVVDFFVSYFSDDGGSPDLYQTSYPDEAPAPTVPTLRSVILEHSPKKREAVIDALPERDAKNYLKQVVTALINRAPILPPELEDDEEPQPGRTALIAAACTALVFIAGIVIFLTLRGGSQGGTPTPSAAPSAPAVSAAPTPTPPASSVPPSDSPSDPPAGTSSGDLGNYHVEIQDAFLASDFEGNPAIIITYTWINNSSETVSALSALSEKAFQNGVQIDRAVVYSRDTPGYDSGTASRSIRPGTESEVQCAYTLRDRVSTVEFEVTEFLGLSGSMVSMDFDPQALNAVE